MMNRRQALRRMAGAVAIPVAGAGAAARPNILLLLADDHGMRYAGCYGNRAVRTPNIDRLANEGLRCTGAFTGTAMCAPSRSMLFTGLYPHRNGAHPNHSSVRPGIPTLPARLSDLGYTVALAGKRHVAPPAAFPFEYLSLEETGSFLARRHARPFCLVVATNDPHTPFKKLPPGQGFSPADVWLPPSLVDTPETRQEMAAYYNSVASLDRQVGQCLDALRKHGLEERTFVVYTSDHGAEFPFSKWTLYDAGLNVPFMVRHPGRIRPGSVAGAMFSFVDVLPALIEIAGGKPPQSLDGRSLLPVFHGRREHRPIIFGTHTNTGIISGSDYPIRAVRTRTHKYIRNFNPEETFTNVTTNGGWKGVQDDPPDYWKSWVRRAETDAFARQRVTAYQHRPPEELYDLRLDANEMRNLAPEDSHRDVLSRLRQQLRDWMRRQSDPLCE